jgi:hypothetical protein
MRLSGSGWVRGMNSHIRLCLCLVLVCLITAGATACPGGEPRIKFQADPLVLDDGDFALYTFVVKDATEVVVIEAGDILKQITNPSAATIKGTVKGNTTYAIRTGDSNTFEATLIARNESGEAEQTLTLSFANELPPKSTSLIPPVSMTDQPRSPQWGEQYSSPTAQPTPPTTPPASNWPPEFAECPPNCKYCLTRDEAASRGFGQRCLEQPCYYSPDNQSNWYCYSEPEGWCCVGGQGGQVTQATKTECNQMGGYWSMNQAEAIQACEPMCWCCRHYDGAVGYVTINECRQVGTCYNTQTEAAHACQEMAACWCCAGGKVFQATQTQCAQIGGACYSTQGQAAQACQQTTTCWCCAGGQVFQATQTQCAQMGGACYSTQAGAVRACQQYPPTQGDMY